MNEPGLSGSCRARSGKVWQDLEVYYTVVGNPLLYITLTPDLAVCLCCTREGLGRFPK